MLNIHLDFFIEQCIHEVYFSAIISYRVAINGYFTLTVLFKC